MLSLNILIGCVRRFLSSLRSRMMCDRCKISLTHLSVAYISASAELRAVIFCLLEDQWTGLCKAMRWPEIDLVLNRLMAVLLSTEGID